MRLKSTLTALALSLSALATLSAPTAPALAKEQDRPEPARVYKDWVVGCHYICEAVAVMPEGDAEGYGMTMVMEVYDWPSSPLQLHIMAPYEDGPDGRSSALTLKVDGRPFARFTMNDDGSKWTAEIPRNQAIVLAKGKRAVLHDDAGRQLSLISLAGSSAAMRDIDERLGDAGFTHALVAKGKKAEPVNTNNFMSINVPPIEPPRHTPPPTLLAEAIARSGCNDDRDDVDAQFDAVHPLPAPPQALNQALVFVGCGHGAYNYTVQPMLATQQKDGAWIISDIIVEWDYDGKIKQPMGLLTNASWDEKSRTLTHYSKGRGLGDCGDSAEYKLEAVTLTRSAFRLSEIREMPVCRGATHWPRIW